MKGRKRIRGKRKKEIQKRDRKGLQEYTHTPKTHSEKHGVLSYLFYRS
jgi:hypothetical protein